MGSFTIREYGSEFWIADDDLSRDGVENKYIMGSKEIYLVNGRRCISYLLDSAPNIPKRAVLPAYICNSAIEPFASRGFELFFYDSNRNFEPDIGEIADLIDGKPSIIVHMGYFGFNTNETMCEIESLAKESNSVVLEDKSHTVFTMYASTRADAEFASIRKWIGIPGGGVVNPISSIFDFKPISGIFKEVSEGRLKYLRMKATYMASGGEDLRARYRTGFAEAERLMDEDSGVYVLDDESTRILKHLNVKRLIERRRANFKTLLKHLSHNERFVPVFIDLPENVCPMFFPVFVSDSYVRDDLQQEFASKGLFCPVHWPRNDYLESFHKEYEYIIGHILSIPCDQRYSEADMERVTEIVNS